MPTSDPRQIAPIIAELQRLQPRSILDVGAGYGKYGVLCREYLDDHRWQVRIDAVEPFTDYFHRSHAAAVYDNVFQVDVRDLRPADATWDVVLLVDVLEHFVRVDGVSVLRKLAACCEYLLVATPREPSDQWDVEAGGYPYGNELEAHMSRWQEDELVGLFPVERFVPVPGDDQIVVTFRGGVS